MHLDNDALKMTEWFSNNYVKLNEDKCHLMIFGAKWSNETTIKIGETCVQESAEENLRGITFYQSLSFKQHVQAQRPAKKAPCSCSNITIHGQRKTTAANEGVRFVSF